MAYLESRLEFSQEAIAHYMRQFNKLQRRPKIREVQQTEDRENCASILKLVGMEGYMTKDDIREITGWTLSQYSTRMTKLIKDHPHQIKYNKNLKRIDKVKSSKNQEKLK